MAQPVYALSDDSALVARLSNGVVARTFGLEVAVQRVERIVRPAYIRLATPYELFLMSSLNHTPLQGLSQATIALFAHIELDLHDADKIWVEHEAQPGWYTPWCILDVVLADPSRVVPSYIFTPYMGTLRCDAALQRTPMLPIFFRRTAGGIGVPVISDVDYDDLPDTSTRISASSLKVVLHLRNYASYESQIQLRLSSSTGNISARRLAHLVSTKVCTCLAKAEQQNAFISHWEDPRWIFGSHPGQINIADVILLGVVWVSPGKITPLLEVREGVIFAL